MHKRHESRWTSEELNFLDMNLEMPLTELSSALGRDPVEVSRATARLQSEHLSEPWTQEEEDFVASTPHFTARQVAQQLGRSYGAVANRRALLTRAKGIKFGVHGANKSPFGIGARPLVAKTCTRCGLLLASEWFHYNPRQNGTGGWSPACRKCLSKASGERENKGAYHNSERYREKTKESRNKSHWIEADHDILRDPDLSLLEKALKLQRSYNAVSIICSTNGYKSHVGLGSAERDQWYIDNPHAKEYAA
jgi:hypothetical protein